MVEIICVVFMAAFCLVAGYTLNYVQRLCYLVERAERSLVESTEVQKQSLAALQSMNTSTLAMANLPAVGNLPAGLYVPGNPDPNSGLTPLVPLRDDSRR
jgi:hypothetical protein